MTDSQAGSRHCLKARVLIVTVQKFNSDSNLSKRVGASRDTKELHKVLFKLGFQVTFKIDYTAAEILQEYKQAIDVEQEIQQGIQEKCLHPGDMRIWNSACRGQQPDEGVYLQTDGVTETDSGCSTQNAYSHYEAVPEDTVVHFSTCSGRVTITKVNPTTDVPEAIATEPKLEFAQGPYHAAFLRPGDGSIFLQSLCKVLMGEQRHWELLRIMTLVNGLVAWTFESRGPRFKGKKQMPCFVSRMRHEIFPFSDRLTPALSTACITTPSLLQRKQHEFIPLFMGHWCQYWSRRDLYRLDNVLMKRVNRVVNKTLNWEGK
eukprot:g40420.t1